MVIPRLAVTALSAALLAACTVGPDYVRPTPQEPATFARAPTAAEAQATPAAAPAGDAFWESFGDAQLTALVEEALHANHDLRIALSRYDRANALLRNARFDQIPTITAQANGSRSRLSADQAPGVSR